MGMGAATPRLRRKLGPLEAGHKFLEARAGHARFRNGLPRQPCANIVLQLGIGT